VKLCRTKRPSGDGRITCQRRPQLTLTSRSILSQQGSFQTEGRQFCHRNALEPLNAGGICSLQQVEH
jgi:hypothetical protein